MRADAEDNKYYKKIIELLLNFGADPHQPNRSGRTPAGELIGENYTIEGTISNGSVYIY